MKNLGKLKLVGLDSNIFIYYFEENQQFGIYAKKVIDTLSTSLKGITSIIAVSEILSKKDIPDKIAEQIENRFFEIPNLKVLEVDRKIAFEAAQIRRQYGFRLPDSIQLATAKLGNTKVFITNDQNLKNFKELKVILISDLA